MTDQGIGAAGAAARKTSASSPDAGSYTDDINRPARPTPISCARRMPMREDQAASTRPRPRGCPGVVAIFTGADIGRRTRSAACPAAG